MKYTILSVLGLLTISASVFAQVSPTPVINNEMRDGNSIRRRALELERVKREANEPSFKEISDEQAIKFVKIKDDFENIQKLEIALVEVYNSDKQKDFQKISDLALEISRKAARLETNLFVPRSGQPIDNRPSKTDKPKNVRDIIIELDSEIGTFIQSPIFTNNKLVDSKLSAASQDGLEKIIQLSGLLAQEAKKLK